MDKNSPSARSICVFCGSSPGDRPEYTALADQIGREMGTRGYRLVYGGGGTGLMGAVARAVRDNGGSVVGVIPEFLMRAEHALDGIERIIVPDMHTRKLEMYGASDAFIILPGGIGTLEEAVEIMCWKRLQLHQKPIIFVADNEYWSPLFAFLKQTITSKFSPDWLLDDIMTATDAQTAYGLIEAAWAAPPKEQKPLIPLSKV